VTENDKPSEIIESLFPVNGTTRNIPWIKCYSKEAQHHFIGTSQSALGIYIRLEPLRCHRQTGQ